MRNRLWLEVVPVIGEFVREIPLLALWSEREDSEYRTSATEERCELGGRSRPPLLRIDVVERRPGASVLLLRVASVGSALCDPAESWDCFAFSFEVACCSGSSSIDNFLRSGRKVNFPFRFTGWSNS